MHIAFGGDNHTDANLQAEADQHVSGVQGIQAMMNALADRRGPEPTRSRSRP